MKSVHGWVLLAVAGVVLWLAWILRFFPSAWALFGLGIVAAFLGISDMRRQGRDDSSTGSDWDN